MKFKVEVSAGELHPSLHHALNVVDRVWRKHTGTQPVCTGLGEVGHSEKSRHYGLAGDIRTRAADIRSRDLIQTQQTAIDMDLRERLGAPKEFDILWEATHLHIEVDPK